MVVTHSGLLVSAAPNPLSGQETVIGFVANIGPYVIAPTITESTTAATTRIQNPPNRTVAAGMPIGGAACMTVSLGMARTCAPDCSRCSPIAPISESICCPAMAEPVFKEPQHVTDANF